METVVSKVPKTGLWFVSVEVFSGQVGLHISQTKNSRQDSPIIGQKLCFTVVQHRNKSGEIRPNAQGIEVVQ